MRRHRLAFLLLCAASCYNPIDPFDPKYPLDLPCEGTVCPPGQTCGIDFVCHESIPCGAGGACPTGLACDDSVAPVCRPECTNGSCPPGNHCGNNVCQPDPSHLPAFTGGPCSSGCQGGTTCAPDQTCQNPCANGCPYGTMCFCDGPKCPGSGFCFPFCTSGSGCPSGFACWVPNRNMCAAIPDVTMVPTQQQFGQVVVGTQSQAVKFTVTNASPASVSIQAMIKSSMNTDNWTIASDMCSAPPPLTAGSTCEIDVRFSPQSAGPKTAALQLFGGENPATSMATLSGQATSM
jgi:hypothetical protein